MLLSTINLFCCILFQCFSVDFLSSDFTLIFALFQFKLSKVRSVQFGQKGIPYLNTYDGRTIRYPDPLIKANDTIKLDLESNKITDFIKFDVGNVVMVTGGRNRGRVGVIKNRDTREVLRPSMSRMQLVTNLQLVWVMSSSLAKGQNLGCLFPKARVSSCLSLRRLERGLLHKRKLLPKFD